MIRSVLERTWWQPRAGLLAWLMSPLSLFYAAAWWCHRKAYTCGWCRSQRAPLPVIVVGNLIVGGAGKTPTVIALVQALRERGWTPGVISRGYRSGADCPRPVTPASPASAVGDEPVLMARRTSAPVWVGRLRVHAARALCAAHPEVDVLVADDGMQHLALARDAQLIVFDERGLGNGLLLPAGPLREPFGATVPPRSAVIYNAVAASTQWPGRCVQRQLSGALPLKDWWAGERSTPGGLASLKGQPLLAAAGIGSPERFFDMLRAAGLQFDVLPLPDHAALEPRPWPADAPRVIVTEKDAVKIPPDAFDADKIHVATLDFQLPAETVDELLGWLEPRRPR